MRPEVCGRLRAGQCIAGGQERAGGNLIRAGQGIIQHDGQAIRAFFLAALSLDRGGDGQAAGTVRTR